MDDGTGSPLLNWFRTPLGIVAGGRGIRRSKADLLEREFEIPRGEVITILEHEKEAGSVTIFEEGMIKRTLRLSETKAKDIMVPRTSVFAVDISDDQEQMIDRIIEERYSRVPVYEKDIDNIIGLIHLKDLFAQARKEGFEKIDIRQILKEPYIVHEYKSLDELFLEMQQATSNMAIVVDEYGGFSGIITIEDLIEQIVGDIADEDDDDIEEKEIVQIAENQYQIDGLTNIVEVNEALNISLPTEYNDTVGGLLLGALGRLPKVGQEEEPISAQFNGAELTALKVGTKRIESLLVTVKPPIFEA